MKSDSPLHPIFEASIYAEYLGLKTHRFMHKFYDSYSKEIQEIYECKECRANYDKTAAMRNANKRERDKMEGKRIGEAVSDYQTPPKSGDFDVNFALAMINAQDSTVKIAPDEFTQKDMEELGNTLIKYCQSAERICLQDICRTRKQLVFSIVSMLFLAQEEKLGFEQDEQKRIFIYKMSPKETTQVSNSTTAVS